MLRERWLLWVILFVAAGLRLYRLDLIDLRYDEASAPQFALSIARGAWLAIAPFSGSVANHPPVFLYVLALPYLLTRDILWVAAYRVLLDVLAVALTWMIAERFFNRRVAAIAALLFALAPWAIQLARKLGIVQPPLFSALLLLGLLELVTRRNGWGWVLAGWGLALSIGSHLSALYLLPATLIGLLMGWRTLKVQHVLLGFLPLLALTFVYLQYDAAHQFANVQALLTALRAPGTFSWDAAQFAAWISGGSHLSDLTDGAYPLWQAQVPDALNWIDSLQVVVLAGGVLFAVYQAIHALVHKQWALGMLYGLLVLGWLIPVALQLRHSQPLQMHYLMPLYPLPFLLMATLLERGLRPLLQTQPSIIPGRVVGVLTGAGWVLIIGWQVLTTLRFTAFVNQYDTSSGGYGQPVRSVFTVGQMAREARCASSDCGGPHDVIAVVPGGDPLVNEQATILNVVLADVPHRFANSEAGLILRHDATQYIFAPGTDQALSALLAHTPSNQVLTTSVPIRTGGGAAYTYVRMNLSGSALAGFTPAPSAHWQNGASLLGFRAVESTDGATLHLDVLLQVTQAPLPGADYHWFNHVLVNGQKVAQLDGGGIQAANWRVGDLLLQRFNIPLPSQPLPASYEVRTGSYEYPAIKPVPVTLNDGQISDGVILSINTSR
jgi:4-amino-4-deoxy-L-arabinose transferase-like glycosyltransferase